MNNQIDLFEKNDFSNLVEQYPMLKLAKDIVDKYPVKLITPVYHYIKGLDGKNALKGYHVEFVDNPKVLSVQFGYGNYCENHDSVLTPKHQFSYLEKANTAEIAILFTANQTEELIYIPEWGDSVNGWQTPEEIMIAIDKYIIGGLPDESQH